MAKHFSRYHNAFLASYSLAASTLSKKHVLAGMPVSISVELTSHCNLNCPECPTGSGSLKRERGFMEFSLFEKLIDEMQPWLLNINLYFQGEPMLHPGFFSFTEKCRPLRSTLSTNGHFLTPENCSKLAASGLGTVIVSLDGMDRDTYLRYREGGDFDAVVEGIRNLAAARNSEGSDLKIVIQFLVNRFNEHQVDQAKQFAKETGCILSLKSMQVTDLARAGEWMPADEKFRRYIGSPGKASIKSKFPNRCSRLWLNPVVTWDGKVLPCCFDKDAAYIMGDLNRSSMREIWNGPEFRQFRESILKNRSNIGICRNCTSGIRGVRT